MNTTMYNFNEVLILIIILVILMMITIGVVIWILSNSNYKTLSLMNKSYMIMNEKENELMKLEKHEQAIGLQNKAADKQMNSKAPKFKNKKVDKDAPKIEDLIS